MKSKKVITRGIALSVSLLGIVLLMVLQFIWLQNAYKISEQNLKDKCMDSFEEAILKAFFDDKNDNKNTKYINVQQTIKNNNQLTIALYDIYTIYYGKFN